MQSGRPVDIATLLPGQAAAILADPIAALDQPLSHHHGLVAAQVDAVNRAVQQKIHHTAVAEIGKFLHIRLDLLIGADRGYKKFLMNRVPGRVKGVERHPNMALMSAPVHIAVDQKRHISGIRS